MRKIKYVDRKLFFNILYAPRVYTVEPQVFVKRGKADLFWIDKHKGNGSSFISNNCITDFSIFSQVGDIGYYREVLDYVKKAGRCANIGYQITYIEFFNDFAYLRHTRSGYSIYRSKGLLTKLPNCCDKGKYLRAVSSKIILQGCSCGILNAFGVPVGEMKGTQRIYPYGFMQAMEALTKGVVAITTVRLELDIWQILDNEDDFNPSLLYRVESPSSFFLFYNSDLHILFSGGNDGYLYCYEVDSASNIQLFLKISIENRACYKHLQKINESKGIFDEDFEYDDYYNNSIMYLFLLSNGNFTGLKDNGDLFNLQKFVSKK